VLDYIAPNTPVEETQEAMLQGDPAQIWVPIAIQGVTGAQVATWNTPELTPSVVIGLGSGPDWNDPILQELDELVTPLIFFTG
jgi:hypothetical protein